MRRTLRIDSELKNLRNLLDRLWAGCEICGSIFLVSVCGLALHGICRMMLMALTPAPTTSDLDLLHEYIGGSQAAFAELVSKYADLVYSAALRQVRDRHLAEDVTQAVFLLLARKARRIGRGAILAAWLHRASRYCASNALRMRANRQRHEQRAAEMKSGTFFGCRFVAGEQRACGRHRPGDRQTFHGRSATGDSQVFPG
jgi:hypothetical protein